MAGVKKIDKKRVQRAFSRQAPTYDSLALLQKEAAERLDFMLSLRESPPERVLDVGSGTGFVTALAASRWKEASFICCDIAHGMNLVAGERLDMTRTALITGDAESLPLADGSVDLVISGLAYQWVDSLKKGFREVLRVLRPGGEFIFSTFGRRTLSELREVYEETFLDLKGVPPEHLHLFPAVHDLGDGMEMLGFDEVIVNADRVKEEYRHAFDLMRGLKSIGAGNAFGSAGQGLGQRPLLERTADLYAERFPSESGIYATFEILYARGVRR